jgi:hypothetical protein
MQQQHARLHSQHTQQHVRLQEQHTQLLQEQAALQGSLASTQAELAGLHAAAEAAEQRRLALPHKASQVGPPEHAALQWSAARGVQTGDDIAPWAKRDASTPADLALLSHFFRDIKQKQRGGGGAILGYDPAEGELVRHGLRMQSGLHAARAAVVGSPLG